MPYYLVEMDGKFLEKVLREHEILKSMFKRKIRSHFGEETLAKVESNLSRLFERARSILITEEERFVFVIFNPEKKIIKARIESKEVVEGKIRPARYVLARGFNGELKLVLEGKIPYDEISYLVVIDEEEGVCECKAFKIGLEKALSKEKAMGISDNNPSYPCKHVIAVLSIYSTVRSFLERKRFSVEKTGLFERLVRRFTLVNM